MPTLDAPDSRRSPPFRFAEFTFDPHTGELFRRGEPLPLPPQATQILNLLLERAGELVSRQEIENRLWPDPTHVEADLSINYVVRRIRAALGDSATDPRFVETLPRRGYRFKAPVERVERDEPAQESPSSVPQPTGDATATRPRWPRAVPAAAAGLALLLLALFLLPWSESDLPARPTPLRLAVFPLTGDEETRSLAWGLGEDLTITLVRYFGGELDLVAFASSRQLGESPKRADVAGRLGADYQLTGDVVSAGDELRVDLRLDEVASGRGAWVASFEVGRHELVEARAEFAREIAAALGRELPLTKPPPPEVDIPVPTYERYLQAIGLIQTLPANEVVLRDERQAQILRAVDLLETCVEEAPGFADAWAALAAASAWSDLWRPAMEWLPSTEAALDRALSLDPFHAPALAHAAELALDYRRDWPRSDALSQRALRHGIGHWKPHQVRAGVLAAAGRVSEARHELSIARRLNPLDWVIAYLEPTFALLENDFADAERQLAVLRESHPEDPVLVAYLVQSLTARGEDDEALAIVDDFYRTDSPDLSPPSSVAEYWRGIHEYLEARHREAPVDAYWRSVPLIGLGRHDAAARLLRDEACGDPFSGLALIHVAPFFRQLDGLPDYVAAVRCAGMPPAADSPDLRRAAGTPRPASPVSPSGEGTSASRKATARSPAERSS